MSDLRKLLDEATPGPWKAHEFKCNFSIFQRDVKPGYQRRIADVIYWGAGNINPQNPMREDAVANARLIALAPDLAAALLKAEEALDCAQSALAVLLDPEANKSPSGVAIQSAWASCFAAEVKARATLTEIHKLTGGP